VILALDLDGTLIDSARDLAESIGEMLEGYGAAPLPFDEVVQMVGEGAPLLVRRALKESGLTPQAGEALARFLKIYDRRLMNHTVPYDGIAESLALAVRRGPLAVLTNKPLGPSIGLLEALGLRGFFARIIGGDSEYGRKPDPAGLMSIAKTARAAPFETLLVGDSAIDLQTAHRAGSAICLARYGFGLHLDGVPLRGDETRDQAEHK